MQGTAIIWTNFRWLEAYYVAGWRGGGYNCTLLPTPEHNVVWVRIFFQLEINFKDLDGASGPQPPNAY